MVEFLQPAALLLLPVAWWLGRRAARVSSASVPFPALATVELPPPGWRVRSRRAGGALTVVASILLILALAGPRVATGEGEPEPSAGVSLVLVVDASGSAGAADFPTRFGGAATSRLDAARLAARRLLAGRAGDLVGVVTFASVPDPLCPLTASHTVALGLLDTVRPATALTEGSNVGDAIAAGLDLLRAAPTNRRGLILVSDGEHNVDRPDPDRPLRPRAAAALAAALGVPVFAIDCGGDPVPPRDPRDAEGRAAFEQRTAGRGAMRAIAERSGGRMFVANDAEGLLSAARELEGWGREDVPTYRRRPYREGRPALLTAGLVALAAGLALRLTAGRAVPA